MLQDRSHIDIAASLKKRGMSLSAVAASLGLHRQSVYNALRWPTSERCELAIAAALGEEPHAIWPLRYQADGTRIFIRQRRDNAPGRSAAA
jgi:Ner family transcriptional regulator